MSFDKKQIRSLVEIYYDVQDVRIRAFNRLRTVGQVEGVHPEILKKLEKQIRAYVEETLAGIPVWERFLKPIKGIGPLLAGGLISYFNPYKADHPSGFWRFAGLHVVNGKAPKRRRGRKIDWNPKARVLMWKVADSFIKQRTPFYRDIYEKAKLKVNEKLGNPIGNPENCPDFEECIKFLKARAERTSRKVKEPPCKLHVDYRARRKMVKQFLVDFWLAWRKLEGLPVTEPYAIAILKKKK